MSEPSRNFPPYGGQLNEIYETHYKAYSAFSRRANKETRNNGYSIYLTNYLTKTRNETTQPTTNLLSSHEVNFFE